MIHTYLCRAPRTTTTTTAGTTTAGASTVLPSDQPTSQPANQPLLLFLFRQNTLALDASLLLSSPLLSSFSLLRASRGAARATPYARAARRPWSRRGRQESEPARQSQASFARVPLAFARSGLLIRTRRCASRARAVSTLPLKTTTRMPRETKA